MIDRLKKKKCMGCGACQNVCPKSAIRMKPDDEGFLRPEIDVDLCVHCNLCERVCPGMSPRKNERFKSPDVFAAWNKDPEVRIESTSGGVFSALAETVIKNGGYVCGAVYSEGFYIQHSVTCSDTDIIRLRQSKYAQSDIGLVFREIQELLNAGKTVLFCGTPCQNAGLQSFLRKEYDNLFCCDFICRGVVSPKVYQHFLDAIATKYHSTIKKIHFKNKDYGWNGFTTKIYLENGKEYQFDRYNDYYMRGYLKYNLYLRPSCHECEYKRFPREADLSLGDFWGIGNYKAELDENKGTSVILVNSTKGMQLLEACKDDLVLEKRSLSEVMAGNSCLTKVAERGKYREYFFRKLDSIPFDRIIENIDAKNQKTSLKIYIRSLTKKLFHI